MRTLTFLLLSFTITLFSPSFSQQKKAPNFSLKGADGKIVELARLKGKAVVVNFWATWCGPCRAEIPAFSAVYEQYKDKGLEIIGVSLDEEGWEVVRPFMQKTPIPYPVVIGNAKTVAPWGDISAIPTTFIVDKNGFVVDKHIGGMRRADFEAFIKPWLK